MSERRRYAGLGGTRVPAEPKAVVRVGPERYPSHMATIVEIEKLALSLTEKERATLASNLLESLPGVLSDEDEGFAEARRRDAEIEANPDSILSMGQLKSQMRRYSKDRV